MTVSVFIAVGAFTALALLVSAVILLGLVVTVSAIVRVLGVMAAIVREGRDRPRAQARDRWKSAFRRHW